VTRAIVFAYHNVGVRCLKVLLAQGIDVALVVTHEDSPNENIWFASVARTAAEYGIPVATPENPNRPAFLARLEDLRADFLFSFYYRHMLKPALIEAVSRGAYNMHGSLLPKYRGRVPINWADTPAGQLRVLRTIRADDAPAGNGLFATSDSIFVRCGDGKCLRVLAAELNGRPLTASELERQSILLG